MALILAGLLGIISLKAQAVEIYLIGPNDEGYRHISKDEEKKNRDAFWESVRCTLENVKESAGEFIWDTVETIHDYFSRVSKRHNYC